MNLNNSEYNQHSSLKEDSKRFIDRQDEFSSVLRRRFDRHEITGFHDLFKNSKCAALSHSGKRHKDIIQFSFIVRSQEGDTMVVDRVDPSHKITTGKSILISWSPCLPFFQSGSLYPSCEEDILQIYHHEIKSLDLGEPALHYIGFARRDIQADRTYYFHVFEAEYSCTTQQLNHAMRGDKAKSPFVKDQELITGYYKPAEIISSGLVTNLVDATILDFLNNREKQDCFSLDPDCVLLTAIRNHEENRSIPHFLFN